MVGVTSQQSMPTPPRHLILPLSIWRSVMLCFEFVFSFMDFWDGSRIATKSTWWMWLVSRACYFPSSHLILFLSFFLFFLLLILNTVPSHRITLYIIKMCRLMFRKVISVSIAMLFLNTISIVLKTVKMTYNWNWWFTQLCLYEPLVVTHFN